jgi:hypothetical protein
MPTIRTAIPRRRYQFGEFGCVLLGEIESPDPVTYHYLLALLREGDAKPFLYVSCERLSRAESAQGRYRMRVYSGEMTQEIARSDDWQDAEAFLNDAFTLLKERLQLSDEMPVRLS